jgi:hypothetical protein
MPSRCGAVPASRPVDGLIAVGGASVDADRASAGTPSSTGAAYGVTRENVPPPTVAPLPLPVGAKPRPGTGVTPSNAYKYMRMAVVRDLLRAVGSRNGRDGARHLRSLDA